MAIGISAYACYFPGYRLPASALKAAWGAAPAGLKTKPVAGPDEDALTLAIAAARQIVPDRVDSLGLASTTLPYNRRVQSGLLVEALGLEKQLVCSEHTTSSRACTEALLAHVGLLSWRGGGNALVVAAELPASPARGGADAALGAGAVALALHEGGEVASCDGFSSYVAEHPGLQFSRSGAQELRDVQVPDYAEAAYGAAIGGSARPLLEKLGRGVADYRFVVLNPPDPRLARSAAQVLGAKPEQWQPAFRFAETGELGAAQGLLGLAAALDAARPGDRILLLAYGSGSAADAVSLTAGPACARGVVDEALRGGQEIDYVTYLKLRGEI